MVRESRIDSEVEELWDEFHSCVNVTSEQLRTWLMVQGSGPEAFEPEPHLGLPEPGRHILSILGKRKVDLTAEDIQVMRETVVEIQDLIEARPEEGSRNEQWRHSLMNLGHDPLNER
ncbi:DUF3140 domain-containing protein [Micromonospora sp. NPDC003197]